MFLLRVRSAVDRVHCKKIFAHKLPTVACNRSYHRLPLLQQANFLSTEDLVKHYRLGNDDVYGHESRPRSSPNVFEKHPAPAAFVLEDLNQDDVAKALIEGGRQKEPFYLFNIDEAYHRIQHFRNLMPRVQIFYAMKANNDDMLLKLCMATGLGFDCASPGEINKIRELSDTPRIIFATPTKTAEQISFASDSGVKYTVFDTSYELKKIQESWPDARLLLRIRVDGESIYKLGKKFGCDFETEAIGLLDEAARLGLNVVGIAFHVGSACSSLDSYVLGLRRSKALFEYQALAGRRMQIVDIGGGFMSDRTDRIDKVAELVNESLEELFPDPAVQIVAEPGRYICDSAYTLYCSINNVRPVVKNGKRTNMLYLNDGIYGTLRFPETWHTVHRFKESSHTDKEFLEDVVLWGPTCDSTDRVMEDFPIQLPRCTPDDWLVFSLQGAYTFGFSTRFSCLGIPLIRPVVSAQLCFGLVRSPFALKNYGFTHVYLVGITNKLRSVSKNIKALFEGSESVVSPTLTLAPMMVFETDRNLVAIPAKYTSRLRHSEVFSSDDFILNPDVSAPLPSTLPPVLPRNTLYGRSQALRSI